MVCQDIPGSKDTSRSSSLSFRPRCGRAAPVPESCTPEVPVSGSAVWAGPHGIRPAWDPGPNGWARAGGPRCWPEGIASRGSESGYVNACPGPACVPAWNRSAPEARSESAERVTGRYPSCIPNPASEGKPLCSIPDPACTARSETPGEEPSPFLAAVPCPADAGKEEASTVPYPAWTCPAAPVPGSEEVPPLPHPVTVPAWPCPPCEAGAPPGPLCAAVEGRTRTRLNTTAKNMRDRKVTRIFGDQVEGQPYIHSHTGSYSFIQELAGE